MAYIPSHNHSLLRNIPRSGVDKGGKKQSNDVRRRVQRNVSDTNSSVPRITICRTGKACFARDTSNTQGVTPPSKQLSAYNHGTPNRASQSPAHLEPCPNQKASLEKLARAARDVSPSGRGRRTESTRR